MNNLFFFLTLCLPSLLLAQNTEFGYITDRSFEQATDFFGHTLIPGKGRIPSGNYDYPLKSPAVRFSLSSTGLEVVENVSLSINGPSEEKKSYRFSIPRINDLYNPSKGFEFVLMNLQDADRQGYLRVFLNEKKEVVGLVFRPNSAEQERIYSMIMPPPKIEERDGRYFTHELDFELPNTDVLWGKVIIPFAQLDDMGDYQAFSRLYPHDRVSIKFFEHTVPKGKKEKLVQYINIQTVDDAGKEQSEEWAIKKFKETKSNGAEATELYLYKEESREQAVLTLVKSSQSTISRIAYGSKTYLMRPGKRKG